MQLLGFAILISNLTQINAKGGQSPLSLFTDYFAYTAKDEPQPQVVAALGLRITN